MKFLDFSNVRLNDGFWQKKRDLVRDVTLDWVYQRFVETHRFDAFDFKWTSSSDWEPHIYWDSDIAKWLEASAYFLKLQPDEKLEAIVDSAVVSILQNRDEHGYFNSYYQQMPDETRFTNRDNHELYCAGHLIEAAIAYYEATGKRAFLDAMCKYADYIERVFKIEQSAAFVTPGHQEIELALVRLYRVTKEQRYLDLAKFFLDQRGVNEKDRVGTETDDPVKKWWYTCQKQDLLPPREMTEVIGHSVRMMYQLCAMADVALETGDTELEEACRRCFENTVNRRMYLTGGVGSTPVGEAFTKDYDLPNRGAYTETCAAIGLALFSKRMQMIEPRSVYADTVERVLYNGFLSSLSQDGKAFFYENPLEIDPYLNDRSSCLSSVQHFPITERAKIFLCSCCPPNILRFLASATGFLCSYDENTVYVHQYLPSDCSENGIHLSVATKYPSDGEISVRCSAKQRYVALRIPGWCQNFKLDRPYTMKNGYAFVALDGETEIKLNLEMLVTFVTSNPAVHENGGKIAVTRGPIVYCAESVDNGVDLRGVFLSVEQASVTEGIFGLPDLLCTGYRIKPSDALYQPWSEDLEQIQLRMIPYYAFANRGESEMLVWFAKK